MLCDKCGEVVKPTDLADHNLRCCENVNPDTSAENESPKKRRKITVDETLLLSDRTCPNCEKTFSRKDSRIRHQRTCNGKNQKKTDITQCKKCNKNFSTYNSRSNHERSCKGIRSSSAVDRSSIYKCNQCNAEFPSIQKLLKHEKETKHNSPGASGGSADTSRRTEHSVNNQSSVSLEHSMNNKSSASSKFNSSQTKCRQCGAMFDNLSQLYKHRMLCHAQADSSRLQADPWSETDERLPWVTEDESINERLRETYHMHRHLILRERVRQGDVISTYNFPVSNVSNVDQLINQTEFIYQNNPNAFKINLSFGLILQHIENGSYRYFAPHYTDGIFSLPQLVSNVHDLQRLRSRFAELDLDNYFKKLKPNSKWRPVMITNVLYAVSKTSFPLGTAQPLPPYITGSKSIIAFEKNPRSGRLYTDNLCFFRCLAYHDTGTRYCERRTAELHSRWESYAKENHLNSVDVTLNKMPDLEVCFEVNINVFQLNEDNIVTPMYKSRETFSNGVTMNLNMFEDHLSYISKFKTYASKFRCRLCDKLFDRKCHLYRHEKTCENATKLKLPGGYFAQHKSIFDTLETLGINVEPNSRNYEWFITYDMEAILKPNENLGENTEHLQRTSTHVPISVSVCSNVDDFETPKFILDENSESLISQMFSYMNEISDKANALARGKWSDVLDQLHDLEQIWGSPKNKTRCHDNDDNDESDEEAMETEECEPPSAEFTRAISKENVWTRLLRNVESSDQIRAEYNDWDDNHSSIQTYDDDDDDDDDEREEHILRFRPLESEDSEDESDSGEVDSVTTDNSICSDDGNDDDDERDEHILHFRPLEREDSDNECDSGEADSVTTDIMARLVLNTRKRFEEYCHQIPVIGFNSGKYDLNLIKTKVAKYMKLHEKGQQKFVVKKNNNYVCLSNRSLRMLDLVNYLPPGTSYDKFLSTFDVSQKKGFFPYEYFTSSSVLSETNLPPKENFYSSLKQCNVLENHTRVKFDRLVNDENKPEREALLLLNLDAIPESTIDRNYDSVLNVWRENKMTTFRDYLEYYNNLDVLPMVEGIEKFKRYFREKQIDIFKDCISVPGAARKLLYSTAIDSQTSFSLISRRDQDLYHTIKSNIIGGPSIIFTRYHEVGETHIRENKDFPCKAVIGLDANSLYLKSFSEPMPCGNYVRRLKKDDFKPIKNSNRFVDMFDWMDWLNVEKQLEIKHKMNTGYEKRIGPYLADGFDVKTNTVFDYLGCFYHSHDCINWSNKEQSRERSNRTKARIQYIKSKGFNVEIIWECEFKQKVKDNGDLKDFIYRRQPSFYERYRYKVSEKTILDGVLDDTLFGMVEVDIAVPEFWDQVRFKPNTSLSPREYFEEMSPLFCTTDVDFEHIGEHMQKHVDEYDLSKEPRTLLVGGMKAEKLLLATPLLKWYIQHGLLVTNIHQVVEFSKKSCFKDFVEGVTRDRREGDVDLSKELKSSLSKLIGNSAFGGTIINQEKFRKIKYTEGFRNACFAVNDSRFLQINELGEDFYECEFANSRISIDSPIYLGYMVLQYAKLHMLSFYYDFMDRFMDRRKFEMIEMDTDSCYFALGSETLKEAIKPEMLKTYNKAMVDERVCTDKFSGDEFGHVWLPRACCEKHRKFDSRTPGLMKLEWCGNSMVCLSSKAFIGANKVEENSSIPITSNVKYSLKGVNKLLVNPYHKFEQVLQTREPISAVNRGIRSFNNTVCTYLQPKQAFNYFYCKRKVHADGIRTSPLDITLKPKNKFREDEHFESLNPII